MSGATSVTVSVTWRPRRFAVRWANSPEDVPPWDVWHTGELIDLPKYGPGNMYPDFPALEDLDALPPLEKKKWEELALQWGLYGSSWEQRGPLRRTVVQENRLGEADVIDHGRPFPRLVRAWPGESRTVRPLADDPGEPSLVEAEWPPQKLRVHAHIAELAKKIPDETAFRSGVIDLAHRYAMLHPDWGDTLKEWQELALGFHYLKSTFNHLASLSNAAVPPLSFQMQEWNDTYLASPIYTNAQKAVGDLNFTAMHFVKVCTEKAEISRFPLRAFRQELSGLLSQKHVQGEFGYAPRWVQKGLKGKPSVGPYLRCGAMSWGFHELAEMLLVDPVRQCTVCAKPMEKRRGSLTCSGACRKKKSREKRG